MCSQFGAVVHAGWRACPLAIPAFAPSWETLERFGSLHPSTRTMTAESPPVLAGAAHPPATAKHTYPPAMHHPPAMHDAPLASAR